jgi:hypothetical protein
MGSPQTTVNVTRDLDLRPYAGRYLISALGRTSIENTALEALLLQVVDEPPDTSGHQTIAQVDAATPDTGDIEQLVVTQDAGFTIKTSEDVDILHRPSTGAKLVCSADNSHHPDFPFATEDYALTVHDRKSTLRMTRATLSVSTPDTCIPLNFDFFDGFRANGDWFFIQNNGTELKNGTAYDLNLSFNITLGHRGGDGAAITRLGIAAVYTSSLTTSGSTYVTPSFSNLDDGTLTRVITRVSPEGSTDNEIFSLSMLVRVPSGDGLVFYLFYEGATLNIDFGHVDQLHRQIIFRILQV